MDSSERTPALPILRVSLAAAFAASLMLALGEWLLAVPASVAATAADLLVLLVLLASLFAAAGAAFGIAQAACLILADRIAALAFRPRHALDAPDMEKRRSLAGALILAAGVIPLVFSLFSGRRISQIPHRGLIVFIVSIFALGLLYVILRRAQRIFSLLLRGELRRRMPLAALLAVSAALIYLADASLYRGLYRAVHLAADAAVFAALECVVIVLLSGGPSGREKRILTRTPLRLLAMPVALALLVLAAAPRIAPAAAAWRRARYLASAHTSIAARLMALPGLFRPRHPAGVLRAVPFSLRDEDTLRLEKMPRPLGIARGMNLLLLTVDALRADHLGCYGYPRNVSPRLDALASGGTRFENAYVPVPYSFFSLLGLLTSRHGSPFLLGLDVNAPRTLADALGEAGYRTGAFFPRLIFFGQNPDNPLRRLDLGFEEFEAARGEREKAPAICGMASRFIRRESARPFFLWAHFVEPHYPFEPHGGFDFGERPRDRYDAEIAYVDSFIGKLLDLLDERGIRDRTVVALASDHGEALGEHGLFWHGTSLYDEQIRVAMLLSVPGLAPSVVRPPVQTIDLAPTLLALLGLGGESGMEGTDISPLLSGGGADYRGTAFSEVIREGIEKQGVRRGRWKLIRDLATGVCELYDMRADPGEKRNVFGEDGTPGEEMLALLERWSDREFAIASSRGAGARKPSARERLVALAKAGDAASIRALLPLLGKEMPKTTQIEIIRAAGSLKALIDRGKTRAALAPLVRDASARLVPLLRSAEPEIRGEAARALARLGDRRASGPLAELMRSATAGERGEIAHLLGRLGDRRAAGALRAAWFGSADPGERLEIAVALARLGDGTGLDTLIEALERGMAGADRREVAAATEIVQALGALGDRRAAGPLCEVLERGSYRNTWYGCAIIRSLEQLGDARAVATLRRVRETATFGPCREAAERAMARIARDRPKPAGAGSR